MTFWGFLLTAITTPSAIIGYFNYFGNDDIAEKLYRSLQVNIRPHLDIKSIYIDDYIEDGQVLGLEIENYSRFWAKDIQTEIVLSSDVKLVGKFNSQVLSGKHNGIPALSTNKIAVIPLSQFKTAFSKLYPDYRLVSFALFDKDIEHTEKAITNIPFIISVSYKSESNESFILNSAFKVVLTKL